MNYIGPGKQHAIRGESPVHLGRFFHSRLDQGLAPKTASMHIEILGGAFNPVEESGDLDKNPVPAIRLPKILISERETFTMAEVEKLVGAAPDLDWQTTILLWAYTRAHLGDRILMTLENVDAVAGLLRFIRKKTGQTVSVPLHPRLVSPLKHLSQNHVTGYLCLGISTRTSGGKHGLSEGFQG